MLLETLLFTFIALCVMLWALFQDKLPYGLAALLVLGGGAVCLLGPEATGIGLAVALFLVWPAAFRLERYLDGNCRGARCVAWDHE